jgi:hypothetical protein
MPDAGGHKAWLQEVRSLSEQLKPVLAGKPPYVQGAALADMLAIWLAGHPADVREELLANHIGAVRALLAELQSHKVR